jgi:hypothetical protein
LAVTDSVQVVDEVRNTDEWQNAHINFAHNAPLHGLVVQVWYIVRSSAHIMFDIALVGIFDVHGLVGSTFKCEEEGSGQGRIHHTSGRPSTFFKAFNPEASISTSVIDMRGHHLDER